MYVTIWALLPDIKPMMIMRMMIVNYLLTWWGQESRHEEYQEYNFPTEMACFMDYERYFCHVESSARRNNLVRCEDVM